MTKITLRTSHHIQSFRIGNFNHIATFRMGDGGTSLQESKCLAGIFSQIVTDCKVPKDKDKDREQVTARCKCYCRLVVCSLGSQHQSQIFSFYFQPCHRFVVSLGSFVSKVTAIELI